MNHIQAFQTNYTYLYKLYYNHYYGNILNIFFSIILSKNIQYILFYFYYNLNVIILYSILIIIYM